jgi:hypothetical protein
MRFFLALMAALLLACLASAQSPSLRMADPEFYPGQHVAHAANANGLFPAGTGIVATVTPWNTGDGYSFKIRCDATGKLLPVNFKASELRLIAPPNAAAVAGPLLPVAPLLAAPVVTGVATRTVTTTYNAMPLGDGPVTARPRALPGEPGPIRKILFLPFRLVVAPVTAVRANRAASGCP